MARMSIPAGTQVGAAWISSCLLEVKQDGSMRFITDYQKVNAVTATGLYLLPRMEDCVDTIGTARYVSKLDLLKGYWQVPLTARVSDHFLEYMVCKMHPRLVSG